MSQPPSQWDCNFESGSFCTWTNDASGGTMFTIQKGETPTPGTGPPADHTLLSYTGTYAYLESSGVSQSASARLVFIVLSLGDTFNKGVHCKAGEHCYYHRI